MERRILVITLLGFLFLIPSLVQSQPDRVLERFLGPMLQSGDLRVRGY